MNVIKSIGVIIAGFLTIFVLTGIIDAVLTIVGLSPFPPKPEAYTSWTLFISFVYRIVFSTLGGFVVGKLAPSKPIAHVIIFAGIGTLIAILGIVGGWNLPWYPHWYPIALAVLTFPSIWYGGKLAMQKKSSKKK